MTLVRILVDAGSLLRGWPALAHGRPRHSTQARAELIHKLGQYHDATGTPVTVVFEEIPSALDPEEIPSVDGVESLLCRAGQSAGQAIEKAAMRLQHAGPILIVTDDFAGPDLVVAAGSALCSSADFIQSITAALEEMERQLSNYNQRECSRFRAQ